MPFSSWNPIEFTQIPRSWDGINPPKKEEIGATKQQNSQKRKTLDGQNRRKWNPRLGKSGWGFRRSYQWEKGKRVLSAGSRDPYVYGCWIEKGRHRRVEEGDLQIWGFSRVRSIFRNPKVETFLSLDRSIDWRKTLIAKIPVRRYPCRMKSDRVLSGPRSTRM